MSGTDDLSLGTRELEAAQALEAELDGHLNLSLEIFNLGLRALGCLPERAILELTQAEKVSVALVLRVLKDLRCAALLAARGYPLQACTLVASMFESAYAVLYIGNDEERAQSWIDHSDPTSTFRPLRAMVNDVIQLAPTDDKKGAADRQYRTYRQLCMAKHVNPLLERIHSYSLEEGNVIADAGPTTSEDGVRAAWFALEHGTGLTEVVLASLIHRFVPAQDVDHLDSELTALGARRAELRSRAIERWGNKNPFAGQW